MASGFQFRRKSSPELSNQLTNQVPGASLNTGSGAIKPNSRMQPSPMANPNTELTRQNVRNAAAGSPAHSDNAKYATNGLDDDVPRASNANRNIDDNTDRTGEAYQSELMRQQKAGQIAEDANLNAARNNFEQNYQQQKPAGMRGNVPQVKQRQPALVKNDDDQALKDFAASKGPARSDLQKALSKMATKRIPFSKNRAIGGGMLLMILIVVGLFSLNFPSFQIDSLMNSLVKYGMKRAAFSYSTRQSIIIKYYFQERFMPGSNLNNRSIANYNGSTLQKLYSVIRDSDFEARLQKEGYEIKYGDPENPKKSNILSISRVDQSVPLVTSGNFETSYNLLFEKAAARAHILRIYDDLYRDKNLFKRVAMRIRITKITGTKWHWLDPIKQPLAAARMKARNAAVGYILEKSDIAQRAAMKIIEKLTGNKVDEAAARKAIQEVGIETAAREGVEELTQKAITRIFTRTLASSLATAMTEFSNPIGWAVMGVTLNCYYDMVMSEGFDTLNEIVNSKAVTEYITFTSMLVANQSQIKAIQQPGQPAATNGTAVDAFIGGVLTDEKGRDWYDSNNTQRAFGKVVDFTPTDDCESGVELCNGKRPTSMLLQTTLGKSLLVAKGLQSGPIVYMPLLGFVSNVGPVTLHNACKYVILPVLNTVSDFVADALFGLIRLAGGGDMLDWITKESGELVQEKVIQPMMSHILLPPVVNAETRGPDTANAGYAGAVGMSNGYMRDVVGDTSDMMSPEAAQKAKLTPEQAIVLDQAANRQINAEYAVLPLWDRLFTLEYMQSPASRFIAMIPSSPTTAIKRSGEAIAKFFSPDVNLKAVALLKGVLNTVTGSAIAVNVAYPEVPVGMVPYGVPLQCLQEAPVQAGLPDGAEAPAEEEEYECLDAQGIQLSMKNLDNDVMCSMLRSQVAAADMPKSCMPSTAKAPLGGKWLSGASCEGIADGSFQTWRGSPVGIAGTWNDSSQQVTREQWSMTAGGEYGQWNQAVDVAIGAFYGGSWAQAAQGSYDADWRTALQNIYAGWGSKTIVYIRFAHEFNGDWYEWSVGPDDNEAFKTTWARFYNMVQEELVSKGKNARVVWSPNNGGHRMNTEQNWPGDQYVDVVGPDYYNWDPPTNDQAAWDAKFMMKDGYGGPLGLGAWQEFARSHGKPIALPEWGSSGYGPDDQPEFIKMMNTWMIANGGSGPGQLIYDVYFNCGGVWGGKFQLYPELALPQESAMYKSLKWGQ